MLRPCREPHEAQARQWLAHRALVHRDTEQGLDARLEVDAAPAHHAVRFRIRTSLDESGKLKLLFRVQPAGPSRSLRRAWQVRSLRPAKSSVL